MRGSVVERWPLGSRRFHESGATAVILRFGSFYGPDSSHTADMVKLARRGFATTPGPCNGYLSFVSTDDAGVAVVVAATEAAGGTYNVADNEPVTRHDFDGVLAAAVGRERLMPVPNVVARLMGDNLDHVVRSHRVSNAALRAGTNWVPRYQSVRDGIPSVVDAIVTQTSVHREAFLSAGLRRILAPPGSFGGLAVLYPLFGRTIYGEANHMSNTGCGCGTMTTTIELPEQGSGQCACGCGTTARSREAEIAELRDLRESITRRLTELEEAAKR